MNCYEAIDLMDDALEGSLTMDSRVGLDQHFAECPACRTYFEQLGLTCRALASLPARTETPSPLPQLIIAFREHRRSRG